MPQYKSALKVEGGQIFIFQKGVMGFFLDLGLKIYGASFLSSRRRFFDQLVKKF